MISLDDAVRSLANAKKARRVELAALPFDRKIEILKRLQEVAYELASAAGRPASPPWERRKG